MDLFALGTPVIDIFAKAEESALRKLCLEKGATNFFPRSKLAEIESMIRGKIMHKYPGDNARNVCEGFSALGGFAGFQGTVGSDPDGAFFESNLAECGIASFLSRKKGQTGRIIALVTPDGQRTFCAHLGVSESCSQPQRLALRNSKIFFLTSITLCCSGPVSKLARKYLEAAKKEGKKVAISVENAPMARKRKGEILPAIRKYADVLFMNEEEAEALFGAGAEKKMRLLKPEIPVYLKRGAGGSRLFLQGRQHKIAALSARVIDTTGAGDAYAAGVLYGLSRGYTALGSAKIGCMLATKVVQKVGAGIPHAHTRIRIRH
ncbi:MAG: adenosine kinase [Candidatus Micrarchaeota archaeon]|nr:adenosine kinase [Candidatus Micrarchaeota archaeon]